VTTNTVRALTRILIWFLLESSSLTLLNGA
jgi:hypothetical protein